VKILTRSHSAIYCCI